MCYVLCVMCDVCLEPKSDIDIAAGDYIVLYYIG